MKADTYTSYPKIYALGHAATRDLLLDEVTVEEKVDGSQFSFGRFDGVLKCRSKGAEIIPDAPEAMFKEAVEVAASLDLIDGYTYRAEYLKTPKHNTIAYYRVPNRHLIIFDITIGNEIYLDYPAKQAEAKRIGLEVVPVLYIGKITDANLIVELLDNTSILGGQKIEGVVVKNYSRFGLDKKILLAKFVSEQFKEVHGEEWKKSNPSNADTVTIIIQSLKTHARWDKAIQHLRDAGKLTESPKDIGLLIKEVQQDIESEEADNIKTKLYEKAISDIRRGVVGGLPEYYKEHLMKKAFTAQS